jgi:hypothetical protein
MLPEELYFRPPRGWICFAVPQLQALHDPVTIQWNRPAAITGADDVSHFQGLRFAIAVMDHNVIKLNWRVDHAKLQEAVPAGRAANLNVVVIVLAVDVRRAQ